MQIEDMSYDEISDYLTSMRNASLLKQMGSEKILEVRLAGYSSVNTYTIMTERKEEKV